MLATLQFLHVRDAVASNMYYIGQDIFMRPAQGPLPNHSRVESGPEVEQPNHLSTSIYGANPPNA